MSNPIQNFKEMIKNKFCAVLIPAIAVHAIWWPYMGNIITKS
jgi:hypothetical protein